MIENNLTNTKQDEWFLNESQSEWTVSISNYLYILIIIRFVSLTLSLLSMSVFANKAKLKDRLYRYMFANSLADVAYTSLMNFTILFSVFIVCNKSIPFGCPSSYSYYLSIVMYILFMEYMTSCLAFFNIVLEIFLTVERIILISNFDSNRLKNAKTKLVCSVIFSIALFLHSPLLFVNKITGEMFNSDNNPNNKTKLKLEKTEFGASYIAKTYLSSLSILRIVLVIFVLLVLNVVALFKFKAFTRNKQNLRER